MEERAYSTGGQGATERLRVPPQSIEAEQSVLGALMLDNRCLDQIGDRLEAEDFYRKEHRLIFRAVASLAEEGRPADVVTVSEFLQHQGELEQAGGLAYIATLAKNTPSAANVSAYAGIVRERSIMRALLNVSADVSAAVHEPQGRGTRELLDFAERSIFAISEHGGRAGEGFQPLTKLLSAAVDRIDKLYQSESAISGLPTGFTDLDDMTSGLQSADLIIVAGRPSMGKCIAYDSELVMDDGSVVGVEEIFREHRQRPLPTLAEDFRLACATPSDYIDDGIKPVFEVTTRLGRRIEVTLTHPFLSLSGWRPLHGLKVGDVVAVPRRLPLFGEERLRECEVKLLAYLIGDGGLTGTQVRFTSSNARIAADFRDAVNAFGGLKLTVVERRGGFAPSWGVSGDRESIATRRAEFALRLDRALSTTASATRAVATAVGIAPASLTYWRQGKSVPAERSFAKLCEVLCVQAAELAPNGLSAARKNGANPLARWLQGHGLMGCGAAQKAVPAMVFRLVREQQALFLNRLFSTDGWATVLKSGQAQLGYSSTNERLARQVQHLLLRFGVLASLRRRRVKYRQARRVAWQLDITHAESILTFGREIGIFGKEQALASAVKAVSQRRRQTNTDLLPAEIWRLVEQAKGGLSWSGLARRAGVPDSNIHVGRRGLSRARLAKFALALGNRKLLALANSDVYWDRIVSIVPAGEKQVYDLTIPGTHNFIANDVCVHNTSLAMNIAENVAVGQKLPVAIYSMEMPGEQLAMRMLASMSRINTHKIRTGRLSDEDWPRVTSTMSLLSQAPIFIDDTPGLTPMELRTRARRLKREHGLGLVLVDYLQMMESFEGTENRATEISHITRGLKNLAKELNVPLIAMSQLNRSLEQRPNKRPVLSDLRESGAIEQDADLILFIYRDEVYNEDSPDRGTAEIIIGKHRNGPTGTVRLTFLGQYTKFENYISADLNEAFG